MVRRLSWLTLSSLLFLLCFSAPVFADYPFQNADASQILHLVKDDLKDLKEGHRPQRLLEITQLVQKLDRGKLNGEDLVELKYLMSMYRHVLVQAETKTLDPGSKEEEKLGVLDDLEIAGGNIELETAERLIRVAGRRPEVLNKVMTVLAKFANPRTVRKLVSRLGDADVNRLAGPDNLLAIEAVNFSGKYGNFNWVGSEPGLDITHYRAVGKYAIEFRGMQIRSGDLLLLDQDRSGGVNTNFSIPRSYATHMGQVVFLEWGGKTYPAFREIAERGIRVLPLNLALSSPFTAYGEIFRPAGKPTDLINTDFDSWAKRYGDDVWVRLRNKDYCYDYSAKTPANGDATQVMCSSETHAFLLRNGIEVNLPFDQVDNRAVATLKREFDFELAEKDRYETPTSFIRAGSSQFYFVGAIESNLFKQNAARELVIGAPGEVAPESLGFLFSHYDLKVEKISPPYLLNQYNFLRNVMIPAYLTGGLAKVKAPSQVLAFAKILSGPLGTAVGELENHFNSDVYSFDSYEPFSLHLKAVDPKFRAVLGGHMTQLKTWFAE